MSDPVESRQASPDLWAKYDLASELALALADATTVLVESRHARSTYKVEIVADLLDTLRSYLRGHIEAEAAGKEGGR